MVPWYPKIALHEGGFSPANPRVSVLRPGGFPFNRMAKLRLVQCGLTDRFPSLIITGRMFGVMSRFLSNATNRIDAKGRVSVPAGFRSVLSERGIQELYCLQDFTFPAVSVGGPDLLDRYERQISSVDPFSPEANRMSLLIHGGGVFMRLDAEGRLMVTDFIRDFTGISSEVTFVGRSDHFQLWQPKAFHEAQAAAREGRMGLRPT
jgi:MraZ protein